MLARPLIFLISIYKMALSPFLPPSCRFYPTCSDYTKEALQAYGLVKGLYLGARRLLRCQPFNSGGFDPVPDTIRPSVPADGCCSHTNK